MIPGFKKKKGGAPPSKSAASAAPPPASKPPEDLMTTAQTNAPKKSKKKSSSGGGGGIFKLLLPVLLILALGAGAYYVYTNYLNQPGEGAPPPAAEQAPPPAEGENSDGFPPDQSAGAQQEAPPAEQQAPPAAESGAPVPDAPADGASALQAAPVPAQQIECDASPQFLSELGLAQDFQISTDEPGVRGLILIGATTENSDAVSRYQHQSWSSAGFLDAFVVARNGDVYFAPSPRKGLGIDVPKNQDHIYKLDTNSGELSDFMTVPAAAPSTPEFPFGVVGLAYNCDTNALYATSIAGSTPENQVGRIYHIDLNTGEIVGQIENMDAYGATVRAADGGAQLVFGSTRDNLIRALDLNVDGNFQGEARTVATLPEPQRARRISINNGNVMVVQAVEFNYGNTDVPQGAQMRLTYNGESDTWDLVQ